LADPRRDAHREPPREAETFTATADPGWTSYDALAAGADLP